MFLDRPAPVGLVDPDALGTASRRRASRSGVARSRSRSRGAFADGQPVIEGAVEPAFHGPKC